MRRYDENLYYYPEKSGLEIVGEVEFVGGYEFDKIVVWRETQTGRIGYGEDAGCSCPTPFEDFELEDIEWDEPWRIALKVQESANQRMVWSWGEAKPVDVVNLIDKIVNPF
jgi:hypothetical protein